jgi:hypothetical protein
MTAQNENDMEITAEQFAEKDYMSANFLVSISGVKYSEGLFKTIHEIDMPVRAHMHSLRSTSLILVIWEKFHIEI